MSKLFLDWTLSLSLCSRLCCLHWALRCRKPNTSYQRLWPNGRKIINWCTDQISPERGESDDELDRRPGAGWVKRFHENIWSARVHSRQACCLIGTNLSHESNIHLWPPDSIYEIINKTQSAGNPILQLRYMKLILTSSSHLSQWIKPNFSYSPSIYVK